ncbi:myb-like protein X [Clarias gariepinus]|uniref:myb-like protein X n=1 Tax=Clarias gariepinus TaxID=13013 RepID=UPI00234E33B4|nr:myb-like protein X [Clarias gariepinus]
MLRNSHSATDGPYSLMEPVVGELQGLNIGSSNLLALPEPCPWDSDDEELGTGGIKPKSSPIPRSRSSSFSSDDDGDSQPPPSSSRRVSFADAFGLNLVSVKKFDIWSMCDLVDPLEVDLKVGKEYFLKLLFALPLTLEELIYRVNEQKVVLESLELLPGTTTLKGTVRVMNLCFDKLVYIRTSLDCWSSHFDLLAEYVPESSDGVTDCFSFKLTLVPPFGEQGARVDFCIRYETPSGVFWTNNHGQNFVLFCREKAKEQDENDKLKPKSCLKTSRHSSISSTTSNTEEVPEIILNCGILALTEPVAVKEEKIQKEHIKLKEENSGLCKKRSKRKAARMAKVQQHFAQRDDNEFQQTDKDADEVDISVPAIDEAPLNLSTPQTNVTSLPAEPEEQDSTEGSMDVHRNQLHATQTQTQEKDKIPVTNPELIISKSHTGRPPLDSVNTHNSELDSQLLESSQDKETDASQSVLLKYHTLNKSNDKSIEKAWECFERMGCTADINSSVVKTNHVDNTLLKDNQGLESFGHQYTFETIVAPLYHQVFERMENDRRGVKNSTSKADKSVGNLGHGSLRAVTYTSVETRSNSEIPVKSKTHVNNCPDYHADCPESLNNTRCTTENDLSFPSVKTKLGAEIDFQDSTLPDINDLVDHDSSGSKIAQPIEKQHSLEHLPSVSREESTTDQTEIVLVKNECLDDSEYSQENKRYSEDSLNTLHQELICRDTAILPTQSEEGPIPAKPSSAIIIENTHSESRSVTQRSLETQISKMQNQEDQTSEQTLNTHIKCLEESGPPMPNSALFHSDILSNVTPKIIQSDASSPSQDLTQVSIKPQTEATIFFSKNLGTMVPEFQTMKDANLINSHSSHHVGFETESNPSDKHDGGEREKMGKDTETIQTEIGSEDVAVDGISPNRIDASQINKNKEHVILRLNCAVDFDELLDKDMAMFNISINPDNPEAVSRKEEDEKEVQENIQVNNPATNEEQQFTEMTEKQSEEVKDIREVKEQLEKKEEQQEDKQADHVEKEEQENDEKVELSHDDKCNCESDYAEDDKAEEKKNEKEKDGEPKRNAQEGEDNQDLEAEMEEREAVSAVTSVAEVQSIPNINSFIRDVHLHDGQNQQNSGLEHTSVQPVDESHFNGEEEIFSGINSSQQALTPNSDETFSDGDNEAENSLKFAEGVEEVSCQIDRKHVAEVGLCEVDTLEKQTENMDDNTSTESVSDDEMELCVLRLKNTQHTT